MNDNFSASGKVINVHTNPPDMSLLGIIKVPKAELMIPVIASVINKVSAPSTGRLRSSVVKWSARVGNGASSIRSNGNYLVRLVVLSLQPYLRIGHNLTGLLYARGGKPGKGNKNTENKQTNKNPTIIASSLKEYKS